MVGSGGALTGPRCGESYASTAPGTEEELGSLRVQVSGIFLPRFLVCAGGQGEDPNMGTSQDLP